MSGNETTEQVATRADVLREITRQVVERGLPAPNCIDLGSEISVQLHFDWSGQLDEWAKLLGHDTYVSVHEKDSVQSSWQYRNREGGTKWLGFYVHLLVIHYIPQGDELIEQPSGGEQG